MAERLRRKGERLRGDQFSGGNSYSLPGFLHHPADNVERAAILLHEAKHLQGQGEKEAYEFVWKNRKRLGWTREVYDGSEVWQNVRRQTRDLAPNLFACDFNNFGDCTE